MRNFLLILCVLSTCFSSACSGPSDAKDSRGNKIRISDYHGKWVFINYWATWCKPCLKEMSALNALYQNNRDQIVVLGVSYDNLNTAEINKITKNQSILYPMLSKFPINKWGVQNLPVLPITFIINPEGKLTKILKGPQTEAQLRQAIFPSRSGNGF